MIHDLVLLVDDKKVNKYLGGPVSNNVPYDASDLKGLISSINNKSLVAVEFDLNNLKAMWQNDEDIVKEMNHISSNKVKGSTIRFITYWQNSAVWRITTYYMEQYPEALSPIKSKTYIILK